MIRNILSVFENETDVKRLFNQERDIIHYRRACLNAKKIKILMMIRMHANKNKKLIISSIDFLITKIDILNCDDTKDRAKNRKNINTYLSAKLDQYSRVIENDNSVKNNDQNKNSKKDFYAVISDEKFDIEVNNLIDQNYI